MNDNFDGFFDNKKEHNSFFSRFFIPFFSGILGAILVLLIYLSLIDNSSIEETPNNTSTITTSTQPTISQISLSDFSNTSVYAANKALPSIVGIEVEFTVNTYFNRTQTATAKGSGIIMSSDGYILTNNHIISSSDSSLFYEVSKATSIKVSIYNDDTQYEATIIGTDEQTDLAVLKIEKEGLTPAELGDSDSILVGQFVLSVGNPLGLQSSVTSGIISALNREITAENGTIYTVIQTDCAINAGNSGGALVDGNGKVIGINTLKLSGSGIEGMGFAIPINDTMEIYNELIKNGKIARPFIGITGVDLSEEQAKYYNLPIGIYVQKIEIQSSAEEAGLKAGDVITAIDGKEMNKMADLQEYLAKKRPGDKVSVSYLRDKKKASKTMTLKNEQGNTQVVKKADLDVLGGNFRAITDGQKKQLNIGYGLEVLKVNSGKFKDAGITKGFIIQRVNDSAVKTIEDLQNLVKEASTSRNPVLYIQGVYPTGKKAYFAVPLED